MENVELKFVYEGVMQVASEPIQPNCEDSKI